MKYCNVRQRLCGFCWVLCSFKKGHKGEHSWALRRNK